MRNLQEHIRELVDQLNVNSDQLTDKDNNIYSLSKEVETLQRHEEDLLSRVKELDNELAIQKATEKHFGSEHSKTIKELDKSRSCNAEHEERIQNLQEHLKDTIQASKQRENDSIVVAQSEAKHDTAILEAKLQSMEQQLVKAEQREEQALIIAKEARHEALDIHQQMHTSIVSARKEMSALHYTEIERMNHELESAKQEIVCLSGQLQQGNILLAKKSEKSCQDLNEAECRIKDISHKLEDKSASCDRQHTELDQVRNITDITSYLWPITDLIPMFLLTKSRINLERFWWQM